MPNDNQENNKDFSKMSNDEFIEFLNNPPEEFVQEQKERYKALSKLTAIAKPISELLISSDRCLKSLNYKLQTLNKEKGRGDQFANYKDAVVELIKIGVSNTENFGDSNFVDQYTSDARIRIEQKLKSLRNPSLILGFEYILDEMIMKRYIDAEEAKLTREEFGDNPLDIFEPEARINIDNYMSR